MQCSVFIATSVDGFIARPDGGIDWLERVNTSDGEDYGYKRFAETIDVLVMGRGTYDVVAGFAAWPYPGKRVIVMTHRPLDAREGVEAFAGTARALADTLAAEGAQRVYVDGGVVIQQFLADGLIDDLTISIIPVVLGAGIRLFGTNAPECGLVLSGVDSWPTGLVQLRYQTATSTRAASPASAPSSAG